MPPLCLKLPLSKKRKAARRRAEERNGNGAGHKAGDKKKKGVHRTAEDKQSNDARHDAEDKTSNGGRQKAEVEVDISREPNTGGSAGRGDGERPQRAYAEGAKEKAQQLLQPASPDTDQIYRRAP